MLSCFLSVTNSSSDSPPNLKKTSRYRQVCQISRFHFFFLIISLPPWILASAYSSLHWLLSGLGTQLLSLLFSLSIMLWIPFNSSMVPVNFLFLGLLSDLLEHLFCVREGIHKLSGGRGLHIRKWLYSALFTCSKNYCQTPLIEPETLAVLVAKTCPSYSILPTLVSSSISQQP